MFVEHKEAGEVTEAPAKTLTFSEAIREGARRYEQCKIWWDSEGRYCAVCGAIKVYGGVPEQIGYSDRIFPWLSNRTGLPEEIIQRASNMHYLGADSSAVADWLESQGY